MQRWHLAKGHEHLLREGPSSHFKGKAASKGEKLAAHHEEASSGASLQRRVLEMRQAVTTARLLSSAIKLGY